MYINLPLDHIALIGYTLLFAFSIYKLQDTFDKPVDLLASVLLLTGLLSLMSYHLRIIRTGKDENNDSTQRNARLLAHTSITLFFLITLLPAAMGKFQFYDSFALAAHSFLAYAVFARVSQLPGVVLLALYFAAATIRKGLLGRKIGMETLTLLGRLMLLVYFSVSSVNAVM